MNFKALAQSVARYFRPAATSVSPKSMRETALLIGRPDIAAVFPAALDRVEEAAQRVYPGDESRAVPHRLLDVVALTIDPNLTVEFSVAGDPASFEPSRPDTAIKPPDVWTWEMWSKEFEALVIDGWSPCSFAHLSVVGSEHRAVFVFGVVRGGFGLWQQPFDVCYERDGEMKRVVDTLTVATHLRSGVGMGVFATKSDAAQACNLAGRCAPWEKIGPLSEWGDAAARVSRAWFEFGIVPSVNAHAHDQSADSGPIPIMGLSFESAAKGKPEKLS